MHVYCLTTLSTRRRSSLPILLIACVISHQIHLRLFANSYNRFVFEQTLTFVCPWSWTASGRNERRHLRNGTRPTRSGMRPSCSTWRSTSWRRSSWSSSWSVTTCSETTNFSERSSSGGPLPARNCPTGTMSWILSISKMRWPGGTTCNVPRTLHSWPNLRHSVNASYSWSHLPSSPCKRIVVGPTFLRHSVIAS